jgi:hypothetical protein
MVVHVRLHRAVQPDPDDIGDQHALDGYYKCFGVTAESEAAAEELAMSTVQDGDFDRGQSDTSLIDPERLDQAVITRSGDWSVKGVWYSSGRSLWP